MSESPWYFSGRGLNDFDRTLYSETLIDNSPVFVLKILPFAPIISPKSV